MKNFTILFAFILTLCACNKASETETNPKESPSNTTFLITSQKAGPFVLGSKIPNSLNGSTINKKIETQYTEGGLVERPVYTVSKKGDELLKLYSNYDAQNDAYTNTIGEIMILSPLFQTNKKISIGSTIQEFIAVYPNYKLWYTYVSDRYILESEPAGIQFLLRETDFTGETGTIKSEKTPLEPTDFKENAEIYKIRIYGRVK